MMKTYHGHVNITKQIIFQSFMRITGFAVAILTKFYLYQTLRPNQEFQRWPPKMVGIPGVFIARPPTTSDKELIPPCQCAISLRVICTYLSIPVIVHETFNTKINIVINSITLPKPRRQKSSYRYQNPVLS